MNTVVLRFISILLVRFARTGGVEVARSVNPKGPFRAQDFDIREPSSVPEPTWSRNGSLDLGFRDCLRTFGACDDTGLASRAEALIASPKRQSVNPQSPPCCRSRSQAPIVRRPLSRVPMTGVPSIAGSVRTQLGAESRRTRILGCVVSMVGTRGVMRARSRP